MTHLSDRAALHWLCLVYAGDITGTMNRARPTEALHLLGENPELIGDDPYLACAAGDEAILRRATAQDPAWVHRAGGALRLPPLVAVTHSSLMTQPVHRERLHACAKFLLDAGASPNQSAGNRWPPASLETPSETERLSALYGAAGQNHDPELTKMLLDAGADPNDGESLYHSLEQPACTRLLLEAGARVAGSNAMYRVLDLDDVDALRLLLTHGGDANERPLGPPASDWGSPLLWAIRRRRSPAHVAALLDAGADPAATTPDGTTAHALALRFGLTGVAELLRAAGGAGSALTPAEAFIAACARGDDAQARAIQASRPGLIDALDEAQRRLLPEFAAEGARDAVMLMIRLGWPVEARGGDWDASALNHAVFRGDARLTRFLLEHGADWRAQHGFGDNAVGTLSWASLNEPVQGGDWLGCAQALADHGVPAASPDPRDADGVLIGDQPYTFPAEVTGFLLGRSAPQRSR
jgi:ankyrin repeat protein